MESLTLLESQNKLLKELLEEKTRASSSSDPVPP